jgi:hypothetical protein
MGTPKRAATVPGRPKSSDVLARLTATRKMPKSSALTRMDSRVSRFVATACYGLMLLLGCLGDVREQPRIESTGLGMPRTGIGRMFLVQGPF